MKRFYRHGSYVIFVVVFITAPISGGHINPGAPPAALFCSCLLRLTQTPHAQPSRLA